MEPDRTIVLKLLESGKDVVTANKALLAEHGAGTVRPGAAAGPLDRLRGGRGRRHPHHRRHQPIACRQPDPVDPRHSQRHEQLHSHARWRTRHPTTRPALAEAQQLGYAEANPAMDVNGSDAAQKLAILAHLAFGARINWRDIPRTGIDMVDVADMRYAKELGYSIKLLAVAELVPEGLELHVSPTLVRHRSPLAEVRGAYNAIRVVGDAVGRVFFHGLGAGQMPTASAVRGRPDRYDPRPHGHHLPHAEPLVRLTASRRCRSAIRPRARPLLSPASTWTTGPA